MAWIKRNKFFVISMVAGLLLIGYCGWLFWNNLGDVASKQTEYQSNLAQYQNLQKAAIYPSDENIASAKADQARVQQLLADFQKAFAPFPPVPKKVDEQAFKAYLGQSIFDLAMAATNAQVALPDGFAFAFTKQQQELNYAAEDLQPWLEQLGHIKALCAILYQARVNSLVSIQRVRVAASDDGPPSDYFDAFMVTNAPLVATPYKLAFKGFSRELAEVLDSLAESSNCFIVKSIEVQHLLEDNPPPTEAEAAPTMPAPPPTYGGQPPGDEGQGGNRPHGRPREQQPAEAPPMTQMPGYATRRVPATVLSEGLLKVTIGVDVVNISGGGN